MNQNLHRLLLEDSMMLNPGDKLICLIQSNHSFLSSPGLLKKQWIPLLKEVMTIEPMHPVQFQTSLFFPFSPWEVRNHPTRMTKKTEMEILCKGTGTGSGGGIRGSLVNGVTKEIKFQQLLKFPLQIMFWKKGSISNSMQVKKVIENIKDPSSRLKPIVMRYMHKYHGDTAASIHLAGLYENWLQYFLNESNKEVHRSAPISSKRIDDEFTLQDDDAAFVTFREYVETEMKAAVLSIYGSFFELHCAALKSNTVIIFHWGI